MSVEHEDLGLRPLTALVTGSTSGIGRAVAERLAADGMSVVVTGRNAQRGAETVDRITAAGGEARFVQADLEDPAGIDRLATEVGEIDVLVNNAGHAVLAPTEEMKVSDYDSMFAGNVRAAFFLVAAFAPAMAARGSGSVINMGSMAGSLGLARGAAYGATKAALASLTQSWTAEYSGRGVRFNTVAPGPVYTSGATREFFDAVAETTAMKRAAEPAESRARRISRVAEGRLHHRRDRRGRRRPHRHLTPPAPRDNAVSDTAYALCVVDAADAERLARRV